MNSFTFTAGISRQLASIDRVKSNQKKKRKIESREEKSQVGAAWARDEEGKKWSKTKWKVAK